MIAALAFAAPSAVPSVADAWECTSPQCATQCDLPITYAIGNLPDELDEAQAIAEIERAFDAWNVTDCVDFGFTYLGRTDEITEQATIVIDTLDP